MKRCVPSCKGRTITALAALLCASLLSARAEAVDRPPVAVRWWGQALVTIETWWGPTIAIDPYHTRIGYSDPEVAADLVLITHEHFDHNNAPLVDGDPAVRRGLASDREVAEIDLTLERAVGESAPAVRESAGKSEAPHPIRIQSIPSSHDDQGGEERGLNAMFLIEVDGVRILHCGDLGQSSLNKQQLEQIDNVDLALIPVGGVYTIDGEQAAKIVEQIDPRFVVPIHYKTPALNVGLNDASAFLSNLPPDYERTEAPGNTLAIAQRTGETDSERKAVVLKHRPWTPPERLAEAMAGVTERRQSFAETVRGMTVEQMNHRPSGGSHTVRWNVEHLAGRELLFFSQTYHEVEPAIPVIDINPAQQPEDYEAAHPDWPANEEARLLERVGWFVRRFAYVLDGVGFEAGQIEAPRGSIKGLTDLIRNHYPHHHQAVREKFDSADWPGPASADR